MMEFYVYLIGYGNNVPKDFFDRLELAGEQVLVVDVRARRRSWAWSYSAPQVETVFRKRGHDYMWLRGLATIRDNGQVLDTVEIFGLQALEVQVRRQGLPVVLMCGERLSQDCHRSAVAQKLRERLEAAGDHLEIRPL